MSRENVEHVRRVSEAYARGDWDTALAGLSDDIEWDVVTHEGLPDMEVFRGRDGVREFLRRFLAMWDDYEAEFEGFIDAGEQVLVLVRERGRGRGSGVTVERAWAQVWTVRGGEAVRFEAYRDRDEARRAARLSGDARIAVIERWAELWNAWDVEGMVGLLHPQVEIASLRSVLEDTTYHGHDGARQFFKDSEEAWEQLAVKPLQIGEVGGRVVSTARLSLLARESHVPVEQEIGWLWEFRDGLVTSVSTYLDPNDAYEAAASAPGYSADR